MSDFLDKYFKITERGSTISTEIRAGTASFFTLSYLLLVNPQIMSTAGVDLSDALVGTALSSAISCFMVGLFANLPFGMAPGLGLSAYLSFSLVQANLATLEESLTAVFTSGVLLFFVALTGFTVFLMNIVPECVKYGIVVGMGLLISMIGMVFVDLIVANEDTLVGLGDVTGDVLLQLTMFGVMLVGTLLYHDVNGGILIGIVVVALLQWTIKSSFPTQIADLPIFRINDFIQLEVMLDPAKAVVLVSCFHTLL
jgi:AGZA family xanthine/uracil permease-like MFS transporter